MHFAFQLRLLFACCCLALLPAQTLLGSLVVSSTPGTTYEATGITGSGTTSADMVGLQIMTYFANGSTDLGIWTPTGISQNNWSFTQDFNQSQNNVRFRLENNTGLDIIRFTLHSGNTSTVFDRTSPSPGTADSSTGRDLQELTSLASSQNINAVYFDQVQTVGSTPQGDLFAGLDVSFSSGISGNNGLFRFRLDTDATLGSLSATIPEPSSALTFGGALIALLLRRRRRPR